MYDQVTGKIQEPRRAILSDAIDNLDKSVDKIVAILHETLEVIHLSLDDKINKSEANKIPAEIKRSTKTIIDDKADRINYLANTLHSAHMDFARILEALKNI